ncbi:MAG: hypothetical protein AAF702_34930 [Chloroflexota bacterium]
MNRLKNGSWPMLIFILIGCALPLQQAPEQPKALDPQAESRISATALPEMEETESITQSTTDLATTDSADEDTAANAVALSSSVDEATTASMGDDEFVPIGELSIVDLSTAGQTFLDAISDIKREVGTLSEHRYVEVVDERGITWQGEGLSGQNGTILLLQPLQSGGQQAARLQLAPGQSLSSIDSPETNHQFISFLSVAESAEPNPAQYGLPDAEILFVRARETSPGVWTFDVRLNHPDTGWEDYTDGWHVETMEGQILATRILLHPHENEMPFSRSQSGIAIPLDVTEVQVRSHDLVSGYGQKTVVVPLSEAVSNDQYEVIR